MAEAGYDNLKDKVDAIIAIQNDRILQIIDKKTSLIDAFKTVDEVLRQGISGISDLITTHGIVNADFADVKAIMQDAGTAMMGIGRASGENRAQEAAKLAINSPLLDMSLDGAKGVLFNITGGRDLGMFEIDEAAKVITKNIDPDAKVKFGAVVDDSFGDEIRITVIATGFDGASRNSPLSQVFEEPKKSFSPPAFFSSQGQQSAPVQHEARKPLFNPQPAQPKPSPSQAAYTPPAKQEEDDELEIPAFIRKKMK